MISVLDESEMTADVSTASSKKKMEISVGLQFIDVYIQWCICTRDKQLAEIQEIHTEKKSLKIHHIKLNKLNKFITFQNYRRIKFYWCQYFDKPSIDPQWRPFCDSTSPHTKNNNKWTEHNTFSIQEQSQKGCLI